MTDIVQEQPTRPADPRAHSAPHACGDLPEVRLGEQVAAALRHARGTRGQSQRGLALRSAVPKTVIARWESGAVCRELARLETVLAGLGFRLVIHHDRACAPGIVGRQVRRLHPGPSRRIEQPDCAHWLTDGEPLFRDAADRAFPAHGVADVVPYPPDYWVYRHHFAYTTRNVPMWRYPRGTQPEGPPGADGIPPSAA